MVIEKYEIGWFEEPVPPEDVAGYRSVKAALSIPMNMPKYNWGFVTQPEPHLGGRQLATPRGKVMGADAGLTINRMDYGVSWSRSLDGGGMVVSNDVKIELNVEARTPPPAPPAAK